VQPVLVSATERPVDHVPQVPALARHHGQTAPPTPDVLARVDGLLPRQAQLHHPAPTPPAHGSPPAPVQRDDWGHRLLVDHGPALVDLLDQVGQAERLL
jgi:hypothetical protein